MDSDQINDYNNTENLETKIGHFDVKIYIVVVVVVLLLIVMNSERISFKQLQNNHKLIVMLLKISQIYTATENWTLFMPQLSLLLLLLY